MDLDPIGTILWIGVAVFAATSLVAVLVVAGVMTTPHQKLLVGTVITQIVILCTSAFSFALTKSQRDVHLPLDRLMVIEQSAPQIVYDGTTPIYLRSPDVSRSRRVVDLAFDLRQDFARDSKIELTLEQGAPQILTIGGNKYRLAFSEMGEIDADPKEKWAQTKDFVFLAIRREK
jgi:hypothetical protein